MNTREQLNQYLLGLEKRLRLLVVSRGVAVALGVALGATLALVLITNAFAFSETSMVVARVVLFIALATAVALGIVMPLLKLNQRGAAGKAEASYAGFEERLVTYVEQREQSSPMMELLAMDTLEHAPNAPASSVIPQKSIFAFATSAGAAGAVLLWMILAGPGFLGFGAKTLWAGPPKGGVDGGGFYNILVEPGNKLVRRRSDLAVTARLVGFQAPEVRLMARYKSSAKWEEAPMLPRSGDNAYEFLFPSVPEPVEYYVDAAGVRSKTYKIDVIDLAGIKNIKVTYHYPTWLGMREVVENPGGDLRAVVGTIAQLDIETDRPLKNGIIELEDGTKISLEQAQGNNLIAKIPIQKDGVYHFAATESSESVRLSQDYFIEAKLDEPPTIKISHPGADARVSPIEEMTVKVEASDDFGLQAMDLHYSVNGAPEKVISLLANKGALTAEGKTIINLEDFKMIPGDVVSMYATAKDARVKATSDILFAEAQPFEKNFTQSQQGGGGGGGGQQQEQEQIAKRQRDIISATHKALNGGPKDRTATAENAAFLSEMQNKLKEQAASLANRTKARELTGTNDQFESFTKEMNAASTEMGPAADKLKGQKWEDAIQPEERALTHLQRAMALFRDIQVARGQQGGGGQGGGNQAARDLANLFDLELDTEKNQYEQAQGGGQGGSQEQQQKIDEALQKLEELAKRQQQLADQSKNGKQQQLAADRWQQEQLRREAEDLKKQLQDLQQQQQSQQMSRNGQPQQGQSQQGQQQGQQQQGQSQGKSSGGQSASQQQLQRMMQSMEQAMENQRQAQQAQAQGNQAQAEALQKKAAEQLKEAGDLGKQLQRQDTNAQLGSLKDRADQLAQQQKDYENRLKTSGPQADPQSRFGGAQPSMTREQAAAMAAEEDKMLEQLKKLEEDISKQARDLRNQQPDASTDLRNGLSELQQNDVERRMEVSSEYIRAGQGSSVIQWQAPVTRSLDSLKDQIARAQQSLKDGAQQGAAQDDRQRQLANIEQMRSQLQQLTQQGQRQGNQQSQQKGDGKGGQPSQQKGDGKGGGQQPGQNGQGGGQQPNPNGGGQVGAYNGGGALNGGNFGGQIDASRYPIPGNYDPRGFIDRTLDPNQVLRDSQRQIAELRQYFRNDPAISGQINQVERDLENLRTGDTASPVLADRLSRTVLPQLETLELQVRREIDQQAGGQVRSGGSDKMPSGYADQVYEYFRNLNKSGK